MYFIFKVLALLQSSGCAGVTFDLLRRIVCVTAMRCRGIRTYGGNCEIMGIWNIVKVDKLCYM
jgi:hypothetical protein